MSAATCVLAALIVLALVAAWLEIRKANGRAVDNERRVRAYEARSKELMGDAEAERRKAHEARKERDEALNAMSGLGIAMVGGLQPTPRQRWH